MDPVGDLSDPHRTLLLSIAGRLELRVLSLQSFAKRQFMRFEIRVKRRLVENACTNPVSSGNSLGPRIVLLCITKQQRKQRSAAHLGERDQAERNREQSNRKELNLKSCIPTFRRCLAVLIRYITLF
jgi:hypothetical protein